MENQVKSKERTAKFGEVYTAPREVNAMIDLIGEDAGSLSSRILEPACGDGNFLDELLRRKLKTAAEAEGSWELHSLQALSVLYGIDILMDNVLASRNRLKDIWLNAWRERGQEPDDAASAFADRLLERNIICGDFLSERKVDAEQNQLDEPIEFIGWTFTGGSKVEMETVLLSDMSCPEGCSSICDFFEQEDAPVDVLDYRL